MLWSASVPLFFDTYSGDRSFFTENRRSSPFLHPVLYGGSYLHIRGFLLEEPSWNQIFSGIVPLLYAGVMSCGVAYTLQIIGQKNLDPTVASLILSLESAVSVLAGWFILGQALTVKELFDAPLVFAAVIWVQMPSPSARISRKYKPKNE